MEYVVLNAGHFERKGTTGVRLRTYSKNSFNIMFVGILLRIRNQVIRHCEFHWERLNFMLHPFLHQKCPEISGHSANTITYVLLQQSKSKPILLYYKNFS